MSWQSTLLDASYKGVAFEVVDDTLRGTHALARHGYPYVDGEDIEDTGCDALTMDITAVLYGDDYEGRLQQLVKVLREAGAGELVHPIYGSTPDCVVADFEVRHSEESPDYAEVRISFAQSVAAAPFFDRELPLALADELDWLSDLAAWQGFEIFNQALKKIQTVQSRWNAFHAAALSVVGVLHGQVGGIFGGALNLLSGPRVLMAELQSVFGSLATMHGTRGGWRDLVRGTSRAVATPRSVHQGVAGAHAAAVLRQCETADLAAITTLVATVGATALAEQAADILAAEMSEPTMTPVEISRLLADARDALQRALAANRLLALMLADDAAAEQLAYLLLSLYQSPAASANDVYRHASDAGLMPVTPYLEGTAAVADSMRNMAHILQKQARAVINLRPPIVTRTVTADTSLHLLAFAWYGDYRRQAELVRLNPQIRHPNFVPRGSLIHAYAR